MTSEKKEKGLSLVKPERINIDEWVRVLNKKEDSKTTWKTYYYRRRLMFIERMIDEIYSFQDIISSNEMLLFEIYLKEQKEILETEGVVLR